MFLQSERSNHEPLGWRPPSAEAEASEWTLIFDCETTVDAVQHLRFGFFQIRRHERLEREGILYDVRTLTAIEESSLRTFTEKHHLELLTVAEFNSRVFLKYGYVRQASCMSQERTRDTCDSDRSDERTDTCVVMSDVPINHGRSARCAAGKAGSRTWWSAVAYLSATYASH
jgi:hypothetical protein